MITISPVFAEDGIPIVYASDAKFLPNTAVAAYSIIKHASPERRYDIILLHNGIGPEPLERFCSMAEGHENVSVRVLDVSAEFAGKDLYVGNRPGFSAVAFYRLLIPWLLPEYHRAIYLDGDTVVCSDIAELYDTDMGDSIVAAVLDMCAQEYYYKANGITRRYRRDVLKMANPEYYFNSGVLLFDLDAFRREFDPDGVIRISVEGRYKMHDQDVLNSICSGRIHCLSGSWNMIDFVINRKLLPEHMSAYGLEALIDPRLIHFASSCKPWVVPWVKYGNLFWLLAPEVPFYKEIVALANHTDDPLFTIRNPNTEVVRRFRDGEVGFRYIIKSAWAWLMFKLKGQRKDEHKRKN